MSNNVDAPAIPSIEDHIQTLADLYNRLQVLRQIPSLLLKTPATNLPTIPSLRPEFHNLKEIGDVVQSGKVQEALRAARDSEQKDMTRVDTPFSEGESETKGM